MLALHAQVKALQEQYGLSYKDAAHHLYLSQLKVMAIAKDIEDQAVRLHGEVDDNCTKDLRGRLAQIDEGTI